MFLENFKKFIKYYGKNRYLNLLGFTILSFIAGFLELIGVALIYPFIMLIINPDSIKNFIPFIHLNNSVQTGLLIGLCVLVVFILKNIFMIFIQYIQTKFVSDWKKDITSMFMKYYVYAPYKQIMLSSQADKLYNIETTCNMAVDGFVMRGLNLLTNVVIVFMIIVLLFAKFPVPALTTLIFVAVTMILQNKYFKKRTTVLANTMAEKYKNYKESLLENISNIKELKILSAEKIFFNNYPVCTYLHRYGLFGY